MSDSNRSALIEKWRRWKARHPDYPLTAHANGQWCKKVLRRVHFFGPLDDPDAAAKVWAFEKDYLLIGEEPPRMDGRMTVSGLCDQFKADVKTRRSAGDLSATYSRDLLHAVEFVAEQMVKSRPVESLRPEDFARLRQAVAGTGRSLRSQKNLMAAIRSMFTWGGPDPDKGMKYFGRVDFGPRFRLPSSDALDREREASGKNRFIDRTEILAMLEHAKPAMRCMILLGVNCGFYGSDSISLTFNHLHLEHEIPHHDFARVKNGRRRVGTLWPETVEALGSYIQRHRKPCASDRVILNQYGRPYTLDAIGRGIRVAFDNLATKAGVTLCPGTSIGSLRHTYGTVVDLAPDQQMIDLSMGHAPKGMQKRIYSQLNLGELDRLGAVAEVVRAWLYKNELAGVQKHEAEDGPMSVPYNVVG